MMPSFSRPTPIKHWTKSADAWSSSRSAATDSDVSARMARCLASSWERPGRSVPFVFFIEGMCSRQVLYVIVEFFAVFRTVELFSVLLNAESVQ